MNGIISSIQRFSSHDGAGLRSTVFLKGCGLRCLWCHNPETLSPSKQLQFFKSKCVGCGECVAACQNKVLQLTENGIDFNRSHCQACFSCADACPTGARSVCGEELSTEELIKRLMQDKPFFDMGGGVTFSGGECLLQADFVTEAAVKLQAMGISVDIDTCGFVPKASFEKVLPYTDEFLFDLKAIDSDVHRRCTGRDNRLILENLDFLLKQNAKIEIRYPFVPKYNESEVTRIGEFLCGKPITRIKVLGYHDTARSKYTALDMTDTMPTVSLPTAEELDETVCILKSFGLNAVNGLRND